MPREQKKKWSFLYSVFAPFTHLTDVGFFTAIVALIAVLQWRTMEKTDQTLKAAQRPWLEFAVPQHAGLDWAGDELTMFATFHLRNTGHSPALNVRGFSKTFLVWDDPYVRKEQNKLCEAFNQAAEEGYGYTIFPNNPVIEHSMIFEISKVEIEKHKTSPPSPYRRPIVVGCFSYFYDADHSVHNTGFTYIIRPRPAQNPTVLPLPKEAISADELELIPWGTSRID